jgi:hypothetical protein
MVCRPYLEKEVQLPQGKIHEQVDVVVRHLEDLFRQMRRLFLVENVVETLKFGVLLWSMTFIGSWFSGMTLVTLAFIALFTIPKFYETYKQPLDQYYKLAYDRVKPILDQVQEKVPLLKQKKQ